MPARSEKRPDTGQRRPVFRRGIRLSAQRTLQHIGGLTAVSFQSQHVFPFVSPADFQYGKLVVFPCIHSAGLACGAPGAVVIDAHIAVHHYIMDAPDIGIAALMVVPGNHRQNPPAVFQYPAHD